MASRPGASAGIDEGDVLEILVGQPAVGVVSTNRHRLEAEKPQGVEKMLETKWMTEEQKANTAPKGAAYITHEHLCRTPVPVQESK